LHSLHLKEESVTENQTPRVLIVGSGAIGSFYGAILHRAGAAVSVVSRSDYQAVSERGFEISSSRLGDLSYRPAAVLRSAHECAQPPDFLVLAVKVLDGVDRAALIRPAVGPGTTIVLIENGIEIEPELVEAFPDNTVISALAFIGVSRVGEARIEHKAFGALLLGDYPRGAGESAQRFAALLSAGGVKGRLSDNVVTERWRKAVWNTPFNPVSVLGGGADTRTMLTAPAGEELIRTLMREVVAVAAAAGHSLPEDIVEVNIADTHKMPAYKNSMALDWLEGRPLELEAILGNVIREAKRYGVAVPRLETVYAATRVLLENRAQLD
jgi:2-dehydropantoate 2-reductase